MTLSYDHSLEPYVEAILGMKAFDVVILDVRGIASFADTFIICSGRSHRQVSAIAEFVQRQLKGKGMKPIGIEGKREGHWILMDYADVIIHVFYEPVRTFYDLENLWADAQRIEIEATTAD
jgi:ribosome-associated protein